MLTIYFFSVHTASADTHALTVVRMAAIGMASWWCHDGGAVAMVVAVVRIFVSHSNLYQSCVCNDGWHLSMSDIFVFHSSL